MIKTAYKFYIVGIVLLLVLLACRIPALTSSTPTSIPVVSVPNATQETIKVVVPDFVPQQDTLIALYERLSPGVVSIQVLTRAGEGLGSGFVFDKEGHIITNYHVIEGTTDLEVDFPSGKKVRGEVVGTDLDSDIAIIKVDVSQQDLFPLPLGDSDQVKIGQTVLAIGNPFGLSGTMTVGIISGIGRTLDSMRETSGGNFYAAGGIIQTDTAINPGNSGGPLINLNGEVIGINRAIRTDTFSADGNPLSSGIGFAISSNIAKRVIPSLISSGKFDYPFLGITSSNEISLLTQEALGLPLSTGVYVYEVTPGTPAANAGLIGGTQETPISGLYAGGDLIIAIDGREVRTYADLLTYLFTYKSPGDQVTLTVMRGNEKIEVKLTLGKRP